MKLSDATINQIATRHMAHHGHLVASVEGAIREALKLAELEPLPPPPRAPPVSPSGRPGMVGISLSPRSFAGPHEPARAPEGDG